MSGPAALPERLEARESVGTVYSAVIGYAKSADEYHVVADVFGGQQEPVALAAALAHRYSVHAELVAALEAQAVRIEAAVESYHKKGMIVDGMYHGDIARCLRAALRRAAGEEEGK